jgi:hypothetical protein
VKLVFIKDGKSDSKKYSLRLLGANKKSSEPKICQKLQYFFLPVIVR